MDVTGSPSGLPVPATSSMIRLMTRYAPGWAIPNVFNMTGTQSQVQKILNLMQLIGWVEGQGYHRRDLIVVKNWYLNWWSGFYV